MKLNINKIIYITLCAMGVALGMFASSICLLTTSYLYNYILLLLTYYLALKTVKSVHKFPLYIKR